MKMITAELTGKPLSFALASALDYKPQAMLNDVFVPALRKGWPIDGVVPFDHTDSATCMASMWSRKINIQHHPYSSPDRLVLAYWGDKDDAAYAYVEFFGSTVAEAVARCVVALQLGDEVSVPDELCGVSA